VVVMTKLEVYFFSAKFFVKKIVPLLTFNKAKT
jgi:hypothetical protein